MKALIHEIQLTSEEHFHGELPPRYVGLLLAGLPLIVRATVAMAFRSRSTTKRSPAWLKRASDIRFLGFSGNGTTRLRFNAPRLKDAAAELYQQGELFPTRPEGTDTALDLFADTLSDVAAANADSERFDRPLLRRLGTFRKVLDGPFTGIEVAGHGRERAVLTPRVIQTARMLCDNTPAPRRVRVTGKLDGVSDSRQAFELLMDDGQHVRGVLLHGSMAELAQHFRSRVLIYGQAHFRPSGALLRIDADEFRPATESDNFFAKVPAPLGTKPAKPTPAEKERMAKRLKSVIGEWPGDETDEQIEAALKELG